MQNNIYESCAKEIFSFFTRQNCKVGQGGFYFRYLMGNSQRYTQIEINRLCIVVKNLIHTGFLSCNNDDFLKLTQLGYDYTQDGELVSNSIDLAFFIDIKDSVSNQFSTLWDIIGKENYAPFYVTGPVFYNTIRPYLKNIPVDYKTFIDDRKKKGHSQSRVTWFRELYEKLPPLSINNFLSDLSKAIENYYKEDETSIKPEQKLDMLAIANLDIKKVDNLGTHKKTIFISYCWETDIDPEHSKWVHKLADDLSSDFNVKIDEEQPLGMELNQFMEQMISNSDKVLIITTPEYKRRADNRIKGVGYETSLITSDLVSEQNKIKFIPIIRKGSKENSYPIYLGNRKGLDMTDDSKYADSLKKLKTNLSNF